MPRSARMILIVLLGVLGLPPAVHADQTPAGDEPIGAGYRMQRFHGELKSDPYQVYLLVRIADENGKIKVCGVYVADMSDQRFNKVTADLHDMNSFLRL